jgi:hypothetical protein
MKTIEVGNLLRLSLALRSTASNRMKITGLVNCSTIHWYLVERIPKFQLHIKLNCEGRREAQQYENE